jgi:hypothetical protein
VTCQTTWPRSGGHRRRRRSWPEAATGLAPALPSGLLLPDITGHGGDRDDFAQMVQPSDAIIGTRLLAERAVRRSASKRPGCRSLAGARVAGAARVAPGPERWQERRAVAQPLSLKHHRAEGPTTHRCRPADRPLSFDRRSTSAGAVLRRPDAVEGPGSLSDNSHEPIDE